MSDEVINIQNDDMFPTGTNFIVFDLVDLARRSKTATTTITETTTRATTPWATTTRVMTMQESTTRVTATQGTTTRVTTI